MAIRLRQSTASQEIPLGYFVDSTDGNTEETALTINNTDIKVWKNGATTLANKNSGGAAHISNGVYYCTLDAADTDTVGPLLIFCHVTGALPIRVECEVLPANVYDSLIGGTDKLDVQVTGIDNGVIGSSAFAASAITSSVLAADSITSSQLAATAINEIADQVWDEPMSGHTTPGSAGSWLITIPQNSDIANAVWNESMAGHSTPGTSGGYLANANANTAASAVRSAVGLASANLDTQLGAIDDFLDTEIAAIKAKTDNLPASPAATGDIPSAASIADAVWDEAIAGHSGTAGSTAEALAAAGSAGDPWATALPGSYGAGTAGKIIGDNLNATVSSRATQTSVDTIDDFLDTEIAAIKAKTDNLPAAPAAVSDIPSAATIADAVWDEPTAGHATAGSTGKTLSDMLTTEQSTYLYAESAASDTSLMLTILPTGGFKVKKNTALNNFEFLMRQSADHISPATGLTITAERSIDGGAFAACTNSASEVGNGVYKINLSAADLNGNVITLKFTATGADQRTITILTQG